MTEMVTSGSMSGDEKRGDGLLGESDNERRRSQSAPPVLYATALDLDSTSDPLEFRVEGEQGSEADEYRGGGPRWAGRVGALGGAYLLDGRLADATQIAQDGLAAARHPVTSASWKAGRSGLWGADT